MSISAVNGVSQAAKPTNDIPPAVTPAPAVTPFSQQLDAQTAAAKGHHHHHHGSAASQSVTSSPAAAASTAGVAAPASIASSLLHLKI